VDIPTLIDNANLPVSATELAYHSKELAVCYRIHSQYVDDVKNEYSQLLEVWNTSLAVRDTPQVFRAYIQDAVRAHVDKLSQLETICGLILSFNMQLQTVGEQRLLSNEEIRAWERLRLDINVLLMRIVLRTERVSDYPDHPEFLPYGLPRIPGESSSLS
jgi:hypothetical protein